MTIHRSSRCRFLVIAPSLCAIALSIATAAMPAPAAAAVASRTESLKPLNACHGALPSFEGAMRKRPRGFINEGAQTAFLSCGFPAEAGADRTTEILVAFRNEGSDTQTVNCTAVDERVVPIFSTKTISIAAGGTEFLRWSAADNEGFNFRSPAVSCSLPSGMLLSLVYRKYSEDVGA